MKNISHFIETYKELSDVVVRVKDDYKRLRNSESGLLDGFRGLHSESGIKKQYRKYQVNLRAQRMLLDSVRRHLAPIVTETNHLYKELFKTKNADETEESMSQLEQFNKNKEKFLEFIKGFNDQKVVFRNYLWTLKKLLEEIQTIVERVHSATNSKYQIISSADPSKINENNKLLNALNIYEKNILDTQEMSDLVSEVLENQKILARDKSGLKDYVNRIRIPLRAAFADGPKNPAVYTGVSLIFAMMMLAQNVDLEYLAASTIGLITTNAARIVKSEGFKDY